jgi:hypothetical protein
MDIANLNTVVEMCLFFVLCVLDFGSKSPLLSSSMYGWGSFSSLLSALTLCFVSIHPKGLGIWASTSFVALLNLGLGLEMLYRGCGIHALSDDFIRSCDRGQRTHWILYAFWVSLSVTKAWFIVLINICLIRTIREAIQVCRPGHCMRSYVKQRAVQLNSSIVQLRGRPSREGGREGAWVGWWEEGREGDTKGVWREEGGREREKETIPRETDPEEGRGGRSGSWQEKRDEVRVECMLVSAFVYMCLRVHACTHAYS